jgi:acetyl esterase/lipase
MTTLDVTQVSVEKDKVVGSAGSRDLLCDVYRAGGEKRTAVLHFHGGGFRGGNKEGARVAKQLAALGYVSIAGQYRLTGEAKWPAQVDDVRTAIRWARANADSLGFDAAKIVLLGHSAGAILSLVAAGSASKEPGTEVAACVAFYPSATLDRQADGSLPEPMPPETTDEGLMAASPISYVSAASPPTILLHGTADTTYAVENSLKLFGALKEAGVAAELHTFPGLGHIFDNHIEFADLSARIIDLFLDRYVVNPREFASGPGGGRGGGGGAGGGPRPG